LFGELAMIHLDVVVVVPRLALSMPHLHEAHAALHEPARDQNLPRLRSFTVHLPNVFGLARNVERIGRVHLHTVRELEGLDARSSCASSLRLR
jgi:hypothetical protein